MTLIKTNPVFFPGEEGYAKEHKTELKRETPTVPPVKKKVAPKKLKSAKEKVLMLKEEKRNSFIDMVIQEVCDAFYLEKDELLFGGSKTEYAYARFVVGYVVKDFKPLITNKTIGEHVNIKDHATVIYGQKKIKEIITMPQIDRILYTKVMALMDTINVRLGNKKVSDDTLDDFLDYDTEMYLNLHNLHNGY